MFRFSTNFIRKTVLFKHNQSLKMAQSHSTTGFEPTFYNESGQNETEEMFFENVSNFVQKIGTPVAPKGVLFIGENHQDPTAHQLELKLLKNVYELIKNNEKINFGFSLEFYNRENQPILDEFLAGFLDYETFVEEAGTGAPGNHEDYKPLLEFCREFQVPVIAANCPRRYSKLVGKNGRQILDNLPQKSRALIAPLPYQNPSQKYCENFLKIMNIFHDENQELIMTERMRKMLDAQSLWDATMAFSISESFEKLNFVAHISGYFHVQQNLGLVEHLNHYSPDVLSYTLVMLPEDKPEFNPDDHSGLADSLILTDLNKI